MLPTTPISLSMQILHVRCSFNRRFSLSRSENVQEYFTECVPFDLLHLQTFLGSPHESKYFIQRQWSRIRHSLHHWPLASLLMAAPWRLCDCGKLRGAEEPDSPFPPNGALLLCCNTAAVGGWDEVGDADGGGCEVSAGNCKMEIKCSIISTQLATLFIINFFYELKLNKE